MSEFMPVNPFRHVKCLSLVWAGGLGVTLLAWGLASWSSHSRLAAAKVALAKTGFATSWAQLKRPDVADERNAAKGFKAAAALVYRSFDCPRSSSDMYDEPINALPYPAEWFTRANASAALNAGAFKAAIAAAMLRDTDIGLSYRQGGANALMGYLPISNSLRALANVLADETLRRHFEGDDAGALNLLDTNLALADSQMHEPLMIPYMVGIGIRALAIGDIPLMASGIKIGVSEHKASPDQIRGIIQKLLTVDVQKLGRQALASDSLAYGSNYGTEVPAYALHPLFDVVHAAYVQQARDVISQTADFKPAPFCFGFYSNNRDRFLEIGRHQELSSRQCAIALAIALYRHDHAGEWPIALEMLVPTYLPEVPRDPHSPEGRPIAYSLCVPGTSIRRPMLLSRVKGERKVVPIEKIPAPPMYDIYHDNITGALPSFIDLDRYPFVPKASATLDVTQPK